jgi:protein-L-isoaspartate(D-aspartate) O-methyltransferase
MVAVMLDLLEPRPDDVVLEVGTGLGYQAALLSELVHRVWSVEIIEELAAEAKERLRRQGHENVAIRIGDGALGWADHAPYDKIIVTAAAELMPRPGSSSSSREVGWCCLPARPRNRS